MVPLHARSERGLSMNRDSQTRMTNDKIRRDDQIRMTKPATAQLRAIGHSGFGFLSSLVIRHSTTYANEVHRPNACAKRKGPRHEPTHPRPLPGGERTFVRASPLLGGVRGGFRVPMHAEKRKGPRHEPAVARELAERSSGPRRVPGR